jgi:hypothetical protein
MLWTHVALGLIATLAALTLCIALVALWTEAEAQRPAPRVRRRWE